MDERHGERDKDKTRQRYRRAAKHHLPREEEQQRKADARKRRAERGPATRRPRELEPDDDVTFEKIKRVGDTRAARPERDLTGLPRAIVAEIHRGRICLDNGSDARLAGPLAADVTLRLAVGDEVAFSTTAGPCRIEALLPRRSVLARPDPGHPARELVLAANVDVAVIVVAATDPPLRPGLIDRMLLALGRGGVGAIVCVNKVDLLTTAEHDALAQTLAPYAELGVPVLACSATTGVGIHELRQLVAGRTCVFAGHSGVGKSSVLNALDPPGERNVGSVRAHDGKGRHTTTGSSLRTLADGTRVIDTPGVRAFGLDDLDRSELEAGFPDFAAFARACHYPDCTHVHEPACAVRDAAEHGALPSARYASYRRIVGGDDAPG